MRKGAKLILEWMAGEGEFVRRCGEGQAELAMTDSTALILLAELPTANNSLTVTAMIVDSLFCSSFHPNPQPPRIKS